MNAVERLCYTGRRGMGALEFEPRIDPPASESRRLEVAALVELATTVLSERMQLRGRLADAVNEPAMADSQRIQQLLRVEDIRPDH